MPAPGEHYLDIHKVAEKVGLSTKTIRRWVKRKRFPVPFEFAGQWTWFQSEIDLWMVRTAAGSQIDPDSLPEEEKKRGQGVDSPGLSGTSAPEGQNAPGDPKKRR